MRVDRYGGVRRLKLALEEFVPVADYSYIETEDLGTAWKVLASEHNAKVEEGE